MIKIDFLEEIGADIIAEITAPLYWWEQASNYKNISISKRKPIITKETLYKEFNIDDFSHEYLVDKDGYKDKITGSCTIAWFETSLLGTIDILNFAREKYLETQDEIWWLQIIQLLPMSYNKKMTVRISYEIINDSFEKRKKCEELSCVNEWNEFFNWVEETPLYRNINEYAKIIENVNEAIE